MLRSRRSRLPTLLLPSPLRALVLLALSLAMVLQPVLASVGEMHELAHDPSGMHSHELHPGDGVADFASTGEQDEEDSSTLHVLLHFAHCTGQATAAMLPWVGISATPATRPAMTQAQVVSQTRLFAPFRPPITS